MKAKLIYQKPIALHILFIMNKKLLFVILLFIPFFVFAQTKEEVSLDRCIDGDTAWFNYNDSKYKFRFLGIDTPEIEDTIEDYGIDASMYTCDRLKKAKKIEIEFDNNSNKKDKYNRYLVYVFVDENLLQLDILKEGLGDIKYLKDNYKYYDDFVYFNDYAIVNKKGIYSLKKYKIDSFNRLIITIRFYIIKFLRDIFI